MNSSVNTNNRIIRGAEERDYDALVALACSAWPNHPTAHYENDPWFSWDQFRLAEVDNRMVSMLKIYRREIIWGEATALMGGIGDVVTHADYRGQGHAAAVMQDAITYMERAGFELGTLFTGINDYYSRLGWTTVSLPRFMVQLGEVRPAVGGEFCLRCFEPEEDIESVAELYSSFNRGRSGTLIRSLDYWRKHLLWSSDDKAAFTVALKDNRMVAYARCVYAHESFNICECIYNREGTEAVTALAAALIARAKSLGLSQVETSVPRDNALVKALKILGMNVAEGAWPNLMLRPINPGSLARKCGAETDAFLADFPAGLPELCFWHIDSF